MTNKKQTGTAVGNWPEFVTVSEVADILRISKMTAYRLVSDGTLESRRVGNSYRVLAASLRAYLGVPESAGLPPDAVV